MYNTQLMPTYEYRCLKCKKKFETVHSMTARSLRKCIYCGGKVERLIGAGAGLIFKGSGFYITDYKNKKQEASPSPAGGWSASGGKDTPAKAPAAESKKKESASDKPAAAKKTEKKDAGD